MRYWSVWKPFPLRMAICRYWPSIHPVRSNRSIGPPVVPRFFASLCNASAEVTTAVEYDTATGLLYALTQPQEGAPIRSVVTMDIATGRILNTVQIQPLKNHNPYGETPFEMVYLSDLAKLFVFYTGTFDQLIFTDPTSGATAFGVFNLASFNGDEDGVLGFLQQDNLADDDTWANACLDDVANKIYFQCSDIDESGIGTPTLCEIPIPTKIGPLSFVNVAIEPLTFGYFGAQYVQVVSSAQ